MVQAALSKEAQALRGVFPAIPLVDSPLVPSPRSAGVFGAHQAVAEQLNQQGFAVIDLGRERMAQVAQTIRAALEPQFDLVAWRSAGAKGGLRKKDACQKVEAVNLLALQPRVLEILECGYGRQPFPVQTLNFPVSTQQPLHSDAVHFHSEPAGFMCGVWVALQDIHANAGPLEYVPGSQKLPYLQAHDVGVESNPGAGFSQSIFHQAWQAMVEAQGLSRQCFTPRLGEALIWSANLLHGGSAVVDPSLTQLSQVTHYFFEGCRHYTPILSRWPEGPGSWRQPFNLFKGMPMETKGSDQVSSMRDEEQSLQQRLSSFDPGVYLAAHPDLVAAGVNAYERLIRQGLQEDRAWR